MARIHFQRSVLMFGLLLFLSSSLALAQTSNSATIDCSGATPGAFTSVAQAVFASPDHTTFTLSGNCSESVINILHRNDLGFFATTPATITSNAPNQQLMNINGSQSISFSGPITINGGAETVAIINSSNISFFEVTIQNSLGFGINSFNSQVEFFNGAVSNNTRSGIVTSGGVFQLNGVNVNNNGRLGISTTSTNLIIQDGNGLPTTVSKNGVAGIQLNNFSVGNLPATRKLPTMPAVILDFWLPATATC